jgi:hypothetical protein
VGTKFSHFSILDSNVEEAIGLLNLIPKRPNILEIMRRVSPKNELWFAKSVDDIKKPENANEEQWQKFRKDWPKAVKYMNSQEREYWVGKNQNWTTVFSEEFGFESIDNYSLILSKRNNKLFLTVGIFDEDVFTLSVIKKGTILAHHVSGNPQPYMQPCLGDINTLAELFNIAEQKDKLEDILKNNNDDLYKKIAELETLFNMKLWIDRSEPREMGWKKVTC